MGGNKRAMTHFKKHNMYKDGKPDHENPALACYKATLRAEVLKEIGESPAPAKPTAPVMEKKEIPSPTMGMGMGMPSDKEKSKTSEVQNQSNGSS